MDRIIYKIVPRELWQQARRDGVFRGAAIDLQDGYIHFSTAEQVRETAAKHFAGQPDLLLVAIDEGRLGVALRWEPSRGGALFPHLYRNLRMSDVVWDKSLPLGVTGHIFPDGVI